MIFIVAIGLVMLVLLSFLCYYSRIWFFVKLITLPLFFLFSSIIGYHYWDNLGKPIERELPESFDYHHHRYVGQESIYVWLYTDAKGDLLYVVPYDRETAKALEEAKVKQSEGGNPTMSQEETTQNGLPQWEVSERDNVTGFRQENK